jgi:hypothetical protein
MIRANDHGQDQLGPALRSVRQRLVKPEPAHRPEHGGDVAVRQRAGDLEGLGSQRRQGLAGEHPAQAVNLRLRPVEDVGERARLDLAALAIALAQEDGGRRIAVWDARDVHDKRESYPRVEDAYNFAANPRKPAQTLAFAHKTSRKFGLRPQLATPMSD